MFLEIVPLFIVNVAPSPTNIPPPILLDDDVPYALLSVISPFIIVNVAFSPTNTPPPFSALPPVIVPAFVVLQSHNVNFPFTVITLPLPLPVMVCSFKHNVTSASEEIVISPVKLDVK